MARKKAEKKLSSVTNNCLSALRAERKLSHYALAEAIEVSPHTILCIERGEYIPSLDLAFRLSKYFGLPIDTIFSHHTVFVNQKVKNGMQTNNASQNKSQPFKFTGIRISILIAYISYSIAMFLALSPREYDYSFFWLLYVTSIGLIVVIMSHVNNIFYTPKKVYDEYRRIRVGWVNTQAYLLATSFISLIISIFIGHKVKVYKLTSMEWGILAQYTCLMLIILPTAILAWTEPNLEADDH